MKYIYRQNYIHHAIIYQSLCYILYKKEEKMKLHYVLKMMLKSWMKNFKIKLTYLFYI